MLDEVGFRQDPLSAVATKLPLVRMDEDGAGTSRPWSCASPLIAELTAAFDRRGANSTGRLTSRCRLCRRGSHDRNHCRNCYGCGNAQRANHFSPIHACNSSGHRRLFVEQMISIKLIECQPDDLFIDRVLQTLSKRARDLFRRVATITAPPDQRRSLIQAMSPITIEIINKSFVGQCLHDQAFFSRAGFILVI
jgi:hypothetical protein